MNVSEKNPFDFFPRIFRFENNFKTNFRNNNKHHVHRFIFALPEHFLY